MSLVYFNSHLYFFTIGTMLIAYFVTFIMEQFHSGEPLPGSFNFTKDEPVANRFIFSYAFATIPYVYFITFIALYGSYYFLFGLLTIWYDFTGDIVFNFAVIYGNINAAYEIMGPWQFGGTGVGEIIAFALAGYRIGYYAEERGWKLYINSFLVVAIYSIISIWGTLGLDTNNYRSFYFYSNYQFAEITFLLLSDMIIIVVTTWIGNIRSIDKNEEERIFLPEVSKWMRYIYIASIISMIGMLIENIYFNLHYRNLSRLEEITIYGYSSIILVISIYSIISLIYGDTSRIRIYISEDEDEEEELVVEVEELKVSSKIISKIIIAIGITIIALMVWVTS